MVQVALLIGVSEYEPGLNPLPGAIKDIEAMQDLLLNPEIGGFAATDVIALKNPERQAAEEAIERLFAARQRDDLVLFYFSGHGIKDDFSNLYLSTRTTRKDSNGELVRSTAVAAKFVQQCMGMSRSRRQVIILDSCFSGAFAEGMFAKDDGAIDIGEQLGGEGRAVLTSSSSMQYSFEQKKLGLSIYTECMVEGITTGEADQDGDRYISVQDLHHYLKKRLKERCPSMQPKIYTVEEGYNIKLSKAKAFDPKLMYQQKVFSCVNQGAISTASQRQLDALRLRLELSIEDAVQINDDVLRPYREQQKKLQLYREDYIQAAQDEYPISPLSLSWVLLKERQKELELQDQDVQPIQQQINAEFDQILKKKYQQKLAQYEKEFSSTFQKNFRLGDDDRNSLKRLQQSLDLPDKDVKRVEKPFLENHRQKYLKKYEEIFVEKRTKELPLSQSSRDDLRGFQQFYKLSDEDIAQVEREGSWKADKQRKIWQQEELERKQKEELERKQKEELERKQKEELERKQKEKQEMFLQELEEIRLLNWRSDEGREEISRRRRETLENWRERRRDLQ
jgi:Caspase domain